MNKVKIRNALILCLGLALAHPLFATDSKIYKTRDAEGNTAYSDTASEGSQNVEVPEIQTYPAGRYAEQNQPPGPQDDGNSQLPPFKYKRLAIDTPAQDEAIRSNPGNLQVDFTLNPGLQRGHALQLVMDGSVVAKSQSAAPFLLKNVDRGTHELQLQVYNLNTDNVVQSSNSVTFTLLRYHKPTN